MNDTTRARDANHSQSGFTLVEALVSIVVLAFGLIAVTNLLVVAASSNSVGNFSTAAAAVAAEQMEILKAQNYTALDTAMGGATVIGDMNTDATGCTIVGYATGAGYTAGNCFRNDQIPGVGNIHTRFTIERGVKQGTTTADGQMLFIRVRSEGTGVLARARSRAEFTEFRSCTDVTKGCPAS